MSMLVERISQNSISNLIMWTLSYAVRTRDKQAIELWFEMAEQHKKRK
jgi:hypothetical protein